VSHLDWRIKHVNQTFLGNPACLRAALAVCRDLIELSTTNLMPVIALNQISWSPLPCRSKEHPASRKSCLVSSNWFQKKIKFFKKKRDNRFNQWYL